MEQKTELRRPGIWTPWASVLCFPCHGPAFKRGPNEIRQMADPEMAEHSAKQPCRPGESAGRCDKCGEGVWVRDDVGLLQRIQSEIGGELQQTGGMCAALMVGTPDGRLLCFSALDGPICMGLYPSEDSFYEGETDDDDAGWWDFDDTPEGEAQAVAKAKEIFPGLSD